MNTTTHIPEETVRRVAEASPVQEIISRGVALRKTGATYTGLCPFHQEKTPSFIVTPARGRFKCFGCGAGGDVFAFEMLAGGVGFKAACPPWHNEQASPWMAWKGMLKVNTPAAWCQPSQHRVVGQYFHSLHMDTGKVHWQGMVIGNPSPGWYLLQLLEWIMGTPNVRHLVKIEDMEGWLFYPDAEAMRFSWREGVARAGGKYRDL